MFQRALLLAPEKNAIVKADPALLPWLVTGMHGLVLGYATLAPLHRELLGIDPFSDRGDLAPGALPARAAAVDRRRLGVSGGSTEVLVAARATRRRNALAAIALAALSLLFALALCEAALWVLERAASAPLPEVDAASAPLPPELPAALREKVARMQQAFAMPRAWDHIELDKRPGVRRPYLWQGVVHIFNADRMRHDGPFPPRDPARFASATSFL